MSVESDVLNFPDGLADGLAWAGFGLVLLAHAAYAGYLLHTGLLRRPFERTAVPYLVAVLATAAWGLAGQIDLATRSPVCRPPPGSPVRRSRA